MLAIDDNQDYVFQVFNDTSCQWLATTKDKVIGCSLTELTGTIFPIETAEKLRGNYDQCDYEQVRDQAHYLKTSAAIGAVQV